MLQKLFTGGRALISQPSHPAHLKLSTLSGAANILYRNVLFLANSGETQVLWQALSSTEKPFNEWLGTSKSMVLFGQGHSTCARSQVPRSAVSLSALHNCRLHSHKFLVKCCGGSGLLEPGSQTDTGSSHLGKCTMPYVRVKLDKLWVRKLQCLKQDQRPKPRGQVPTTNTSKWSHTHCDVRKSDRAKGLKHSGIILKAIFIFTPYPCVTNVMSLLNKKFQTFIIKLNKQT